MPLDGHAYLKNQGWQGKGNALRHGAISRPIAIPQKRTLAGVGKDRDEAFPFWDHVFNAAASAIQIKLSGDDDEDSSPSSTPAPSLKRTATGILSNKRPTTGTPAHLSPAPSPPHSHLPSPSSSSSSTPPPPTSRLSVLATAKRESARRNLYSRFFRGPVLGPDQVERAMVQTEAQSLEDKLAGEDKAFVDALARGKVVKGAEKSRKDSVGQGDEKSPRADDQGVKKKKRSKEKEERRRAKEARRAAKAARRAPATTDLPTHPEQPGEEGAQSARTDAAPRDERAERRERKKKRKRDEDAEDVVEVKAGKREKKKKKRRKEGCADEQETGAKAETKMKTQVKKVRFALADADEPSTPPACSDRSDAPPSAAKRHKKRKRALDED